MRTSKVFEQTFSVESLRLIYNEKIQYSRSVGLDKVTAQAFSLNLENNLMQIERKVLAGTYRFTNYRQLLILKGAGKAPREVSIPTVRDQVTLCALQCFLSKKFPTQYHTPLPQIIIQSVIDAKRSGQYDTFLKFDITRFYSSIDHEILIRKIRRTLRKKEAVSLIQKAIKTPTAGTEKRVRKQRTIGVPEGISIAGLLANIYLHDIDTFWEGYKTVKYQRYVDDILILCKMEEAEKVEALLTKQIKELKLEFNEKKQKGSMAEEFNYLGYCFKEGKVTVRESSVHKLEANCQELFSKGRDSRQDQLKPIALWKLNLRITGFIIDRKKYGWLFFFSQIDDITLLVHLDWLIKSLFQRYHCTNGGKIKSFKKAFYEMRYHLRTTKYIPNFSTYTYEQKQALLSELGISYQNDTVDTIFHQLIIKTAEELEKDVQSFS